MTNKEFVLSVYAGARCAFYADRKECLIICYPNTILLGIITKAKTPRMSWKRAAIVLRENFLKKLES